MTAPKLRLLGCLGALAMVLAPSPKVLSRDSKNFLGQWIWSRQDRKIFLSAQQDIPGLLPGLWVDTLSYEEGTIRQTLALPPTLSGQARIAVVIRFDTSLNRAWDRESDAGLRVAVDEKLSQLMDHIVAAGAQPIEVQLDYDCPVRRLARWSGILGFLSQHSLRGRSLWITSLLAQLREPNYGTLFQDTVSGHILQVFDTGESSAQNDPSEIRDLLERAGLPFRIGLGAFERRLPDGGNTGHRDWFEALPRLADSAWFRGIWIFPAGQNWLSLLPKDLRE